MNPLIMFSGITTAAHLNTLNSDSISLSKTLIKPAMPSQKNPFILSGMREVMRLASKPIGTSSAVNIAARLMSAKIMRISVLTKRILV
jgi:hypothetical protein